MHDHLALMHHKNGRLSDATQFFSLPDLKLRQKSQELDQLKGGQAILKNNFLRCLALQV